LEKLGAIRRLADGMLAKAAKRVEDTAEHTRGTDRTAAELCARVTGVSPGEAKRAIEVAGKLESLPATDAAVRAGSLSARAADLIVSAASEDPTVEQQLIKAAGRGMVPLRDAVIAARARREDEAARAKRQHAARSFRTWTAADGMVEGHFTVTPQVGGAIKAVIEKGTGKRFRAARKDGAHESQDAYAADAFADAVIGDPDATPAKSGGGWTANVLVDHEALKRGHAVDGETCEIPGVGPVSVEWVRELLGSAFVTAVIKQGKDITTVAHFGRHIPAELRTAMIVSGRECSIEGCSGREYLELDHCETDYADHGPTAWGNLAWLCPSTTPEKRRAGCSAHPTRRPESENSTPHPRSP
jgi:hypothetical protein